MLATGYATCAVHQPIIVASIANSLTEGSSVLRMVLAGEGHAGNLRGGRVFGGALGYGVDGVYIAWTTVCCNVHGHFGTTAWYDSLYVISNK